MKQKKYNYVDWKNNDENWHLIDGVGREVLFKEDLGDRVIGYIRECGEDVWMMAVIGVCDLYMVQDDDKKVLGIKWTLKKRCSDGGIVGDERVGDVVVVEENRKKRERDRIWKKLLVEVGERIGQMDGVKRFDADREKGTVELIGEREEERWYLFERDIDI